MILRMARGVRWVGVVGVVVVPALGRADLLLVLAPALAPALPWARADQDLFQYLDEAVLNGHEDLADLILILGPHQRNK